MITELYSHFIQFPLLYILYNLYHKETLWSTREIGRRDIFTKNIIKKAQNDINFIPLIMNYTIFDTQKYFQLSSAAIRSSCWTTSIGGSQTHTHREVNWILIQRPSSGVQYRYIFGSKSTALSAEPEVNISIRIFYLTDLEG